MALARGAQPCVRFPVIVHNFEAASFTVDLGRFGANWISLQPGPDIRAGHRPLPTPCQRAKENSPVEPIRRNGAHLGQIERDAFIEVIVRATHRGCSVMASSCGTNRPRSTKARMCSAGPGSCRGTGNGSTVTRPCCRSRPRIALRYWDWSETERRLQRIRHGQSVKEHIAMSIQLSHTEHPALHCRRPRRSQRHDSWQRRRGRSKCITSTTAGPTLSAPCPTPVCCYATACIFPARGRNRVLADTRIDLYRTAPLETWRRQPDG